MTTIGILGAGQAGRTLARAASAVGYDVVIANSRSPETLHDLVRPLGPRVRAAWATDAAAASDFAVLAYPYAPGRIPPVAELTGKVVLDNNNHMPWRDGRIPAVDSGRATVHELRQAQLPGAKLAKALSHIQFHGHPQARTALDEQPALMRLARPAGDPARVALVVSSDHPEAVDVVRRLYDRLGFDTVDDGPLRESWRSAPGTPMWQASFDGQTRDELIGNLRRASRDPDRPGTVGDPSIGA
jgi:predicted dinucleotide-binding enzyme